MEYTYPLIFLCGFSLLVGLVVLLNRFQDWFYGIDPKENEDKIIDE